MSVPMTREMRWKAASLRSGFGAQVLSVQSSAPGVGFGSSTRSAQDKAYISPEVDKAKCKAQGGSVSQGAIYRVQETLGRQFPSTMHNAGLPTFGTARRESMARKTGVPGPGAYRTKENTANGDHIRSSWPTPAHFKFGTADRDAAEKVYLGRELANSGYGKDSPGPNGSTAVGCIGRQPLSGRTSSPAWSMGSGLRSGDRETRRAGGLPGAGQYRLPGGIGSQVLSPKRTGSATRFGSSTRDSASKVYISAEHEKGFVGLASPGPCTAVQKPAYGPQYLSSRPNSPAVGFARGRRDIGVAQSYPGPGEYNA